MEKVMVIRYIILLVILNFGWLYSGGVKGFVYRKAKTVTEIKINRYSIRNTISDDIGSSSSNNLAIVYVTGDKPIKGKPLENEQIKQENQSFVPWLLPVYVGTKVNFPNMDIVFHNVFSYSKTKKFDLGRYGKGESKQVTFDKTGLVKVFCEIHKTMRAYVLVLDTPYFTTTDNNGSYEILGIPDGVYMLHVWQENTEEYTLQIEITDNKTINIEVR